jgi:adenine-specific DNA-methyltransferase
MELEHPYLKRQLIAYIGNKRALQGFLCGAFRQLCPEGGVFLDPFAGSGAVSRLARFMGFRVLANDWEFFAYVLNFAHLCVEMEELPRLFRDRGGAEAILGELNALGEPPPGERYVSVHYAPADTAAADYRRERLFYTRENALRIDAVRNRIEELYPGFELPEPQRREKLLLLASLLYQCATHTNTSGVFKACHKGFGGHGRDALKRILGPIELQVPVLIQGRHPAEAGCQEAATFVRGRSADLCYLDPPYNQHQYGSNYHLLNTIALWDRPPVSRELGEDGRLRHKAGIRADWVKTRSAYCNRRTALPVLRELLEALDARTVVLSYNTEGIMGLEELVDTLRGQGRLRVLSSDYVKYRGGKQSLERKLHNQELLLVLERFAGGKGSPKPGDRRLVERTLLESRLRLLLRGCFHPERIREAFGCGEREPGISFAGVELSMLRHHRFLEEEAPLRLRELEAAAGPGQLRLLEERLSACACRDRLEEIEVLVAVLERPMSAAERRSWQRRLLWLLRKVAHRKYRASFAAAAERLRVLASRDPERYGGLAQGLEELEALARARFEG